MSDRAQMLKSEIATAALMRRTRLARSSRADFFEFVWTDERSRPVKLAPFHREWLEALDASDRVFIEGARGHGKTAILSTAMPIYELGRDPNVRIKLVAQSDPKARERLSEIRRHIKTNPLIKLVFPNLAIDESAEDSKRKLTVVRSTLVKDPSIEAVGVMSSTIGAHEDLLIFDDIVDMRNSILQPLLKEQVKQKVLAEWLPTLAPDGRVWSVSTPWTCLPGWEYVTTARGRVRVDELREDDEILVGDGKWMRPRAIAPKPYVGELVRIKLSNVPDTLCVTAEHSLITMRGSVRARDLVVGDHLPLRTAVQSASIPLEAYPQRARPRVYAARPHSSLMRPRVERREFQPHGSAARASMALGYSYTYGRELAGVLGGSAPTRHLRLKRRAWRTEAFWFTVGLWLAEGTAHERGTVHFWFGNNDHKRVLASRAVRALRAVGTRPYVRRHKYACYVVEVNCTVLASWLATSFSTGAARKRLPAWFEKLPARYVFAAFRGWVAGVGSVRTDGASVTTVSSDLAYDWQRVLAGHRLKSSVTRSKPPAKLPSIAGRVIPGVHPVYVLGIAKEALHAVGLTKTRPLQRQVRHPGMCFVDGSAWLRVKHVERMPFVGPVWDVETQTGEFATRTVSIHNCDDILAYLRASSGYLVVSTPVGTDDDPFASIWLDRWPREVLEAKFRELGSVEYDRAYRCIALSSDAVPVQPGWIKFYDAEMLGDPWRLFCLQSYDLAISLSKKADYFAGVTLLYDEERNLIFVVDAWRARLSMLDQATATVNEAAIWRPNRIVVERGGYQGAFAQYLGEHAKVPLPIWPFTPRGSKGRRLFEITPLFQDGRILFHPRLDPRQNPSVAQRGNIIGELLQFPLGAHDDMCDALSQGIICLRESFPSGDRERREGFEAGDGLAVRMTVI